MRRGGFAYVSILLGVLLASLLALTTDQIIQKVYDSGNTAFRVNVVAGGGGGGTPASPDTSVQFNDGGSFGGNAAFTFNKTTTALDIGAFTGGAVGSDSAPVLTFGGISGLYMSFSDLPADTLQALNVAMAKHGGGFYEMGGFVSDDETNDQEAALQLNPSTFQTTGSTLVAHAMGDVSNNSGGTGDPRFITNTSGVYANTDLYIGSWDGGKTVRFFNGTAVSSNITWLIDGTTGDLQAGTGGGGVMPVAAAIGSAPTCDSSHKGMLATATDCNAGCTQGGACTTGGAIVCPIYCDGSAWKEH